MCCCLPALAKGCVLQWKVKQESQGDQAIEVHLCLQGMCVFPWNNNSVCAHVETFSLWSLSLDWGDSAAQTSFKARQGSHDSFLCCAKSAYASAWDMWLSFLMLLFDWTPKMFPGHPVTKSTVDLENSGRLFHWVHPFLVDWAEVLSCPQSLITQSVARADSSISKCIKAKAGSGRLMN